MFRRCDHGHALQGPCDDRDHSCGAERIRTSPELRAEGRKDIAPDTRQHRCQHAKPYLGRQIIRHHARGSRRADEHCDHQDRSDRFEGRDGGDSDGAFALFCESECVGKKLKSNYLMAVKKN